MLAKSVACPLCGRPATITLWDNIDILGGSEGHRIEFECATGKHRLSEVEMLRLWAADRSRDPSDAGH